MKIRQRIGDRLGEAATFNNLGILSRKRGLPQEGIRLIALGYIINESIGHKNTQLAFNNLTGMASQLNYSAESFGSMLKEVCESYSRDRGWSLIRAAFPET